MRLADLVKIDHRFEKSVNLLLDLNDESKLKLYIPTRSSIKLLTEYLEGGFFRKEGKYPYRSLWKRKKPLTFSFTGYLIRK